MWKAVEWELLKITYTDHNISFKKTYRKMKEVASQFKEKNENVFHKC